MLKHRIHGGNEEKIVLQPISNSVPQFWLFQKFGELGDPFADAPPVQVWMALENALNIQEVFGSVGHRFHNNQVFRGGETDFQGIINFVDDTSANHFLLKRQNAERNIYVRLRADMAQEQHAVAPSNSSA